MRLLTSSPSMPDAAIIQGMLQANGVDCMLQDRNNAYVPIFGGVDILVADSQYDRARRLLEEHNDA